LFRHLEALRILVIVLPGLILGDVCLALPLHFHEPVAQQTRPNVPLDLLKVLAVLLDLLLGFFH